MWRDGVLVIADKSRDYGSAVSFLGRWQDLLQGQPELMERKPLLEKGRGAVV